MEKSEIREIINFMKVIYQGRKIDDSEDVIQTWEIMFDDYSKKDVLNSVKRLVQKSKYVPSIHEIIDNIIESFTVEKSDRRDCIMIRVRYQNEIIPFMFTSKPEAMKIINYLKLYPSREDIKLLYERNVRDMNVHTKSTFVNQSERDAFDQRRKNEYYAVKLKNQN